MREVCRDTVVYKSAMTIESATVTPKEVYHPEIDQVGNETKEIIKYLDETNTSGREGGPEDTTMEVDPVTPGSKRTVEICTLRRSYRTETEQIQEENRLREGINTNQEEVNEMIREMKIKEIRR